MAYKLKVLLSISHVRCGVAHIICIRLGYKNDLSDFCGTGCLFDNC